jgi:2-oxoglutarate ferredoxin oxidoreductase subunit alpha
MARETLNILIGGEAGQGLVTVGELLARCLVRSGRHLQVTQGYMSRIRGGHNTFVLRTSVHEVPAPAEGFDLVVALDPATARIHEPELKPEGLIVVDEAWGLTGGNLWAVPYKTLASGRYMNTASLGVIGALIGLGTPVLLAALEKAFGKKHPDQAAENANTLEKAYAWTRENRSDGFHLAPAQPGPTRLILNGNDAISLGAMAAGVRFCAFYPMTPATTIALNLADRAAKLGLVVEQAEDEIAAVNMAVGAAYTGLPSLVSTSGGGFALMVEGISLAAMLETPLVAAVIQRPGPATGLPTRTAQADLEYVLFSGHGEFPRAIFAPGTIDQCFHRTVQAFHLAEDSQGPVFILSDQFLSDSLRDTAPFDLASVTAVNPADRHRAALEAMGSADPSAPYQRYALTPSGISPRLLPGLSEHLVVSDSDEHTEDGHLTEDLDVARKMVEKRLKKADLIRSRIVPPDFWGDDPADLLLVGWGSTLGAMIEAGQSLRDRGRRVGVLHFSQVWPLAPEQFLVRLESAGRVVAVEGNATGQLANLIRRETGFRIDAVVLRYDGLPLTPEFILRGLEE